MTKEDHVIMSEPEEVDHDYIYAKCKCPVLSNYGIKITKRRRTTDSKVYRFKCKKCGFEGVIIV